MEKNEENLQDPDMLSKVLLEQHPHAQTDVPPAMPWNNDFNPNKAWELSSEDVIEMVEHILKGHIKKADGTYDTTQAENYRLMNDHGVFRTITSMQATLNKNTYLSNFDEQKTMELIRHFSIYFAELIGDNYHEFGIKVQYFDYIHELVVSVIAFAIQRQMGGGERILRGHQISEQRIIRQDMQPQAVEQQKKKSFLSGIIPGW